MIFVAPVSGLINLYLFFLFIHGSVIQFIVNRFSKPPLDFQLNYDKSRDAGLLFKLFLREHVTDFFHDDDNAAQE